MTDRNHDITDVPGGRPIRHWTRGVAFDDRAREQLRNVARMPFVHRWVAAMPDVHLGLGATIGSVIPTRGAIIPAAVGVDIGCGMMAVRTSLGAKDLPDSLAGLRTAVLICSDADARRALDILAALEPELVLFPNNRSNLHDPETFAHIARVAGAPVVLANRSGMSWQYECNGGSCVIGADGSTLARANRVGREEILICEVPIPRADRRP